VHCGLKYSVAASRESQAPRLFPVPLKTFLSA
jgi:hypothetical protein